MNKIEELLKDWVLDDKTQEAQKVIFAGVPESKHHKMDLHHKLGDFIEKSPRRPDQLFDALSLPVDRIKIESATGSGFKRSFVRGGKRFARPELVAKEFYESQGYKVSWSEGVAFGMALDAIQYEVAERLKGYFKVIPGHIYTDAEIEEIRNGSDVSKDNIIKNNDYEKRRPAMLEAGGKSAAQVLINVFDALFSEDDYVEKFEHISKSIDCSCSLSDLKLLFDQTLHDVVINASGDLLERWLPSLVELQMANYRDKWNYTEWSIAFAKELLIKFPRQSIYDYILKRGCFSSQCFDLSLFDFTSGEIKFIEVKLDDKLTEFQLMDLKTSIFAGLNIGLAVIEVQ